jgi:hypothetical protein
MKIIIRVPDGSIDIGTDARFPDIPIHYLPLDETEYTLDIPPRTSIETLRNIIRDRENLPITPNPGIRIILNGIQLEPPTSSLLDHDLGENAVINIIFRLRG